MAELLLDRIHTEIRRRARKLDGLDERAGPNAIAKGETRGTTCAGPEARGWSVHHLGVDRREIV
jgi:hypothetical protein